MSMFKSICFGLFMCLLLACNIGLAQENMSADDLYKKAVQYEDDYEHQQAMQWYLKLAAKDDINAMTSISNFYLNGLGVEKNLEKAEYWRQKAEKTVKARY